MKKQFVVLLLIGVVVFACSKSNTSPQVNEQFSPTPYSVQIPSWVSTFLSPMPANPTNPLTVEGISLGRKLFYEPMLSDNQTQSCASCHMQNAGFTDTAAFSKGTNGAIGDRNAMQIINLAWSNYLFWDGRRTSLEAQAHDPVTNPIEMRNTWQVVVERLQNDPIYPGLFFKAFGTRTIDSNLVTKAIAQFERTLVSFNSRFDKYYFEGDTNALNAQEKRGLSLFFGKADCNHCHSDVLLTDDALRNNGLDVRFNDKGRAKVTGLATDEGKFKVPTLRNIAETAPYMHDSRFKTLEEVITHYSDNVKTNSPNLDENMEIIAKGLQLSAQEKADLIAFLKTMSDPEFLNNPNFKKPE